MRTYVLKDEAQPAPQSMLTPQRPKLRSYRYMRAATDLEQSTSIVGEPPDGGREAWLQVLGGFFIWMNTLQVPIPITYYSHSNPCQRYHERIRRIPNLLPG